MVIYTADFFGNLYVYEDKPQGKWKKLNIIFNDLKKEKSESLDILIRGIFNHNNNLFLIIDSSIYQYDSENENLVKVYPDFKEGFNPLHPIHEVRNIIVGNNKIYFRKIKNLFWLRWLDLNTFITSGINLDRPYFFKKIRAIINDRAFICGYEEIYQLTFSDNTFEKWLDQGCSFISFDNNYLFQPIINTDKIVYYYQTCGMGCAEPQLSIINFSDQSVKKIDLPIELKNKLTNNLHGFNWRKLSVKKYLHHKILFSFEIAKPPKEIEFYIDSQSWSQILPSSTKEEASEKNNYFCNPVFRFEDGVFKKSQSCQLGITKDGTKWIIEEPTWENKNEKLKLIKKDYFGKDEVFYFPETIPPPYSPFENFFKKSINATTISEDKISIVTNVGLYIFDTKNHSWKIISINDGLISNNVLNFVVDDEKTSF